MRACSRYAPTGLRNRALIALLYRAGLRINEALSLYPKDLDLNDGCIRVLNGKGGRSRTVGLDPGAAAVISVGSTRGPASVSTQPAKAASPSRAATPSSARSVVTPWPPPTSV